MRCHRQGIAIEWLSIPPLVYLTSKHMLAHALVENNEKNSKNIQKLLFFIVRMRDSHKAHARTWRKCSFLAFMSGSHMLVDTQKLVAPQQFHVMFLREPYVRVSCVPWKKYFFDNFQAFFVVFNHANACASMHSLVEIHNRGFSVLRLAFASHV